MTNTTSNGSQALRGLLIINIIAATLFAAVVAALTFGRH